MSRELLLAVVRDCVACEGDKDWIVFTNSDLANLARLDQQFRDILRSFLRRKLELEREYAEARAWNAFFQLSRFLEEHAPIEGIEYPLPPSGEPFRSSGRRRQ